VRDRLRGFEPQSKLSGLGPVMSFRGVFVFFDPETLKAGVDVRFDATALAAERDDAGLREATIAYHGGV